MPDPEDRPGGLLGLLLGLGGARKTTPAPQPSASSVSAEEEAEAVDIVDQAEAFQTLRVADVMTPRADVVAVEVGTPLGELLALFVDAEHSRMPVFRETLDDPLGVVHIKDLLRHVAPAATGDPPAWDQPVLSQLLREALYIPASMRANDLLVKMRAQRVHMALVIDEFGGTDGLVTMEDLIEAVVGDIEDEHDVASAPTVTELGPDLWEADGRTPVEELETLVGQDLTPEDNDEEIDTVSGLVATVAGRVPASGEVVPHPDGFEFEVLEADPRRIIRVRVRRTVKDGAGPDGEAGPAAAA